jgi:hypothetical protein
LTQNAPVARIRGQVDERRPGKKATSGGSRLADVNDPTDIPTGARSRPQAVTTATPVGKLPNTCRNQAPSNGVSTLPALLPGRTDDRTSDMGRCAASRA